jgi:hypothetical protein
MMVEMARQSVLSASEGAGQTGWSFVPELATDVCTLEAGQIKGQAVPVPFTLSALVRRDQPLQLWGDRGDMPGGSSILYLCPMIYPSRDGSTLTFGGVVGTITVTSSGIPTGSQTISSPATVIGDIRYPKDQWQSVGGGYTISGGGLHFDATGVSLIVGTQYRRQGPTGSDAVADTLRPPEPQGFSANTMPELSVTEIALSSTGNSARKALDRPATVEVTRLSPRQSVAGAVYISHATVSLSRTPDVLVEWKFYRQEGTSRIFFNRTSPQPFNAQTLPRGFDITTHRLVAAQEVPLASFPPGDYVLEVTVSDRLSGKVVTREARLVVVPGDARRQ